MIVQIKSISALLQHLACMEPVIGTQLVSVKYLQLDMKGVAFPVKRIVDEGYAISLKRALKRFAKYCRFIPLKESFLFLEKQVEEDDEIVLKDEDCLTETPLD
jgi:hypothetical protein